MADKKSLVLVVGAGASKEAHLPLGSELKSDIASALDIRFQHGFSKISGDDYITEAFRALTRNSFGQADINAHLGACWMIRDAMHQAASIDNYIDAHRGNVLIAECGKLAIARCILNAESKSLMKVDTSNIYNKMDFKALDATWFNSFFRLIVDNCVLEDIPERLSNISIITFNYDRCIEHYLYGSLRNYYNIESQDAAALMTNLRIHHAYGSIGSLEWQTKTDPIAFGITPNPNQLIAISRNLKTFTEGTDETHSDIVEIRSILKEADRVAFLGFAFNRQNLDLLYGSPESITERHVYAYGTGVGLSESDLIFIAGELYKKAGYTRAGIELRKNYTCKDLVQEYGRSLSIQ